MIALKWWQKVLKTDIVEEHTWEKSNGSLVHMFVDARSTPARCAAVLYIDGGLSLFHIT